MSDNSFFREVDEAVRQERYKALWDRYGIYIIVAAAALVIGFASYRGWTYWSERQAEDAGAKFSQALVTELGSDPTKAKEAFEALVADGPFGYRVLSRFQLAAGQAKAGETENAVAAYDALASEGSIDPTLKGLARIQAAALRLDDADYAEMERRLQDLIDSNSAWRFSARELLGLSAYQHKDYRTAEDQFGALMSDQGTPPNMRERADMMLALIASSTPLQTDSKTN